MSYITNVDSSTPRNFVQGCHTAWTRESRTRCGPPGQNLVMVASVSIVERPPCAGT